MNVENVFSKCDDTDWPVAMAVLAAPQTPQLAGAQTFDRPKITDVYLAKRLFGTCMILKFFKISAPSAQFCPTTMHENYEIGIDWTWT